MKLYMPEKFRWGVDTALTDRAGRHRYHLIGEAYSLGKRLHMTDLAGREAVYVKQVIPALFPTYALEVYGKPVGNLVKNLSFQRPRLVLEGLGWEIPEGFGSLGYELTCQGAVVAACHSDPETPGQLVLDLQERTAELPALAVLLTINCVLAAQESRYLS